MIRTGMMLGMALFALTVAPASVQAVEKAKVVHSQPVYAGDYDVSCAAAASTNLLPFELSAVRLRSAPV